MSFTVFNMSVKIYQCELTETTLLILKAISKLEKEKQDINVNKIATESGVTWKTVKNNLINNFKIKEIKNESKTIRKFNQK